MLRSFFFFNDTATTEIYTLSLHDALPICTKNSTVSRTIARFSSSVVRSASRTCRTSDFATRQTTGVSASSRARTCGSSSTRTPALRVAPNRSEEHTSELQSRQYLVCRLLLEKKKAHV